jgi:hypothetical protein
LQVEEAIADPGILGIPGPATPAFAVAVPFLQIQLDIIELVLEIRLQDPAVASLADWLRGRVGGYRLLAMQPTGGGEDE